LLVEYLPLYNATQRKRHAVRPGITGWAQVNGRNAISWEKKFEYDIWYVEHISFALDLKILWMTIMKVARSEGISAANAATMERVTGNYKTITMYLYGAGGHAKVIMEILEALSIPVE